MKRQTRQCLKDVRGLLASPRTFTRGVMARDEASFEVAPWDSAAAKWCLLGALEKVTHPTSVGRVDTLEIYSEAHDALLHHASTSFPGMSLIIINDELGHKAVLQLIDDCLQYKKRK